MPPIYFNDNGGNIRSSGFLRILMIGISLINEVRMRFGQEIDILIKCRRESAAVFYGKILLETKEK